MHLYGALGIAALYRYVLLAPPSQGLWPLHKNNPIRVGVQPADPRCIITAATAAACAAERPPAGKPQAHRCVPLVCRSTAAPPTQGPSSSRHRRPCWGSWDTLWTRLWIRRRCGNSRLQHCWCTAPKRCHDFPADSAMHKRPPVVWQCPAEAAGPPRHRRNRARRTAPRCLRTR